MQNWIKVERLKKGLTHVELATLTNVSPNTILALEGGKYQANVEFALKVAKVFNKKVEDIFFLTLADVPKL